MNNISKVVKLQKDFFMLGITKNIDYRVKALKKLKLTIKSYENEIFEALKKDLGKSREESYLCEVGFILDEINFTLKNIKKWAKPKKVKSSLAQIPGKSYIYKEPYGNVLIMSPWNYPFQLAIAPLISSIAAGNCSIIKPSEYSHYTSSIIKRLIESTFEKEFVHVLEGGRVVNEMILKEKFDYIFFTGSPVVGKIVMKKASENLTPVTLELGGKSPCIVHKDCSLDLAAKKIVWGKFLNLGQTCIAPDYLFIHKDIKNDFIKYSRKYIKEFYGDNPLKSNDYGKVINLKHFNRLKKYLNVPIVLGGEFNENTLKIEPTFVENVPYNHPLLNEEIFGPILPIIEYENINSIIKHINNKPKPLALYLFTNDKEVEETILNSVSFGGGCINDVVLHIVNPNMPFGGVGNSGIGAYHGVEGFKTFTHYKSILKKSTLFDIPLRYPPYFNKLNKIKKVLK